MASFDDDADPAGGSPDEFENEDEEMEDVNEDADQDQGQDDDGGDEDEDEDNDDNDNDPDDDEDEDQNEPESPSRRLTQTHRSSSLQPANPEVVLTSPSPRRSPHTAGGLAPTSFIPPTRPEALTAQAYDIVPTMAAPQSTSINAITATPDMRWVFSGGSDGYVRMFNWVETANGKVPLTVAQKHPFVDSVMKAGSLLTYWENEEAGAGGVRTPPSQPDEGKWTSPVYSLAVQHQAIWLLSGLESGGINLQTCRHQAGTRITTLKEHSSAVSVLQLSQDETSLLSGSWDKVVLDWDLQSGKVKRSFSGSGGQISAIETRPLSDVPVPEVAETVHEPLGTFSSNNADRPLTNGVLPNGTDGRSSKGGGDEDAMGSPTGSLFGENDHGSLFGEDTGGGGGGGVGAFDDAEDELERALQDEMGAPEAPQPADEPLEPEDVLQQELEGLETEPGIRAGGPVRDPAEVVEVEGEAEAELNAVMNEDASAEEMVNGQIDNSQPAEAESAQQEEDTVQPTTTTSADNDTAMTNGDATTLPRPTTNDTTNHSHPQTPPTTTSSAAANSGPFEPSSSSAGVSAPDLPPQSESTFLSASIDGVLRIWDRRIPSPIATISPYGGTPPWCTGACWSPDGNWFFAGRRNNGVDEYSIHKLGGSSGVGVGDRLGVGAGRPNRTFRFQQGSGNVYAVRAMPNGRHLVW